MYGNRVWPVAAGYQLVSAYYDEWYWQFFWTANEYPLIVRELTERRCGASPALDVGTGTGRYLAELTRLGIECVGVDISQAMLDEARGRVPASARLVCGSVEQLPFPDETFNLGIACRVLSHVADLNSVLRELGRVTRARGILIVSDITSCHEFPTTVIPIPGGDVYIETCKHTAEQLVAAAADSGSWKVEDIESVTYKDLLWKPPPSEYPAIDPSSTRPIFFHGILTRLERP